MTVTIELPPEIEADMLAQAEAFLPGVALAPSTAYSVDVDAKEAIAATLAFETWRHRPCNRPSAPGARCPVILGKINLI